MSNLVVPDDGKRLLMIQMAGAASHPPVTIRLFQNNYTPDHTSLLASFTEATFAGYAGVALSGASIAGAVDGSGRSVCTWTAVLFTKSAGTNNDIYGYYVVDGSSPEKVLYAERFDGAPIPMTATGAFIQITPKLTNQSQFSNT